MPELMQLLSGKSIILYFPPNATAGFATFAVKTPRRLPCPPAHSIAIISFLIMSLTSLRIIDRLIIALTPFQ